MSIDQYLMPLLPYKFGWIYGMKKVLSTDLKDKQKFDKYYKEGYRFIRKFNEKDHKYTLRNPTIGCYVEIFKNPYYNVVPINSIKGKKLINKICYV